MKVKHVGPRTTQSDTSKEALTLAMIDEQYPKEAWIHAYTDGSATDAVRNGGAGVLIRYPNGENQTASAATGSHCTNYNAEVQALLLAATMVHNTRNECQQVVFLSDAMSVLQALNAGKEKDLLDAIREICTDRRVAVQWIPAHCGISGNEQADRLAKTGAQSEQPNTVPSYQEKKTMIKSLLKPRVEKDDYHILNRQEQVTILRLRSGHNRLNHHLATKLKLVPSPLCPCGKANQTAEHILQECELHNTLRQAIWPAETPIQTKLCGCREELIRTVEFILQTGLAI